MAAAVGCSSGDDDSTAGTGGTGGTTGGTGAGGKAAGGTGGTGGAGGTSGGATTGGAGGGAGVAMSGGSAGTLASGGSPPVAGKGGSGGTAGTSGAGGVPPMAGTGGDMGGSGAVAGTGGGGMPAMLVTPIMRSATSYVLEFGDTYLEVNPMIGARVVDLHLKGGTNLVTGPSVDPTNYGGTFWPSPQADWTWPPTDSASITNINDKPYTASSDDTSMTFVGTASAVVGLSVTKKFAADLAKEAIVVTYTMIGTAADASAAPWEITRFPQGGVTFYPTGTTPVAGNGMELPPTTVSEGCTWLTAPASLPTNDQKMNADGTGGWLAHADGDWVVVKKFTDMPAGSPPAATAEAEIEIYLSKDADYMEVEMQGPYAPVPMGAGVTWTVTWLVRKLPTGVMTDAPNKPLADFVKSLVQ
jgi:hypothetical protein